MKALLLAGGLGTRISEESVLKPKPMIEIGGKPILWHIMKMYSAHGKLATITAVQPPGRYGALKMKGHKVESFMEKPKGDGGVINGGFFVLNSQVIKYIKDDSTFWEKEPMEKLASDGQMHAFVHDGFWQPMDTLRKICVNFCIFFIVIRHLNPEKYV